jgi:hypothetical protein
LHCGHGEARDEKGDEIIRHFGATVNLILKDKRSHQRILNRIPGQIHVLKRSHPAEKWE